jgi:hypothetical protein
LLNALLAPPHACSLGGFGSHFGKRIPLLSWPPCGSRLYSTDSFAENECGYQIWCYYHFW